MSTLRIAVVPTLLAVVGAACSGGNGGKGPAPHRPPSARASASAIEVGALVPFTSKLYGYSLSYPNGWSVKRAERQLDRGEFPSFYGGAVDLFEGSGPLIGVGAQDIAKGTTPEEWTNTVVRIVRTEGVASGCGAPDSRERVSVGGERGNLLVYPNCNGYHHQWVTLVHGMKAFHIYLLDARQGTEGEDRALFKKVLQTFKFTS